jgi:hypothetical protein
MARNIFVLTDSDDPARSTVMSFTEETSASPITIARSDFSTWRFHWIKTNPQPSPGRPYIYGTRPNSFKVAAGITDATPTGGTFTLTGAAGGTTSALAYNASAATVQTAVRASLTGFGSALVTLIATGVYEIDRGVATAVGDITGNADGLVPSGSTLNISNTQDGTALLNEKWQVRLSKALPFLHTTGSTPFASPTVTPTILQAGSATASKVYTVTWNADAIGGSVWLNVSTTGSDNETVGPIIYNATAEAVKAAFAGHTALTSVPPEVEKTGAGAYNITFALGLINTPTIATASNTLSVPVGDECDIAMATGPADAILAGATSKPITLEIEIRETSGRPRTILQQEATLISDLILNTPGQATGDENWLQASEAFNVINVRAYGATGDGTTDDHTAIAEAVAELNASGGILYFPPGIYLDSGSHAIAGPLVEHPAEEIDYQGNVIIAGAGTASVWKYTGTGVFLTISTATGPPSNVIWRDLQIKGPSDGNPSWDGTSIGLDIISTGVDFQLENVAFCDWGKIGLRAWDATSFGMRQVSFRRCKLGLAGDFKFDGVVLARVVCQNCDVGIDLGYYNSARTYVTSPPQNESVVLIGCIFGVNRIALIIGGAGTAGVSVIGGYFEGNTDVNIDIGHNTVDYSGLQLETTATVGGVTISGTYFQGSAPVVRVWCPTGLTMFANSFNGATAPFVDLKNANADTSALTIRDVLTNGVQYSGGADVSTPMVTPNTRYRSFLTVDSTEIAPLILNGSATSFPGIQVQLNSVVQGYWVCAGSAGGFLLDSQQGDMLFRSEADRILFGVGAANSTFLVSATQVVANAPSILKSYTVAGVPAAGSHTGGMIYVSNEAGGAVPAFSDGTNWLRVTDRNVIS